MNVNAIIREQWRNLQLTGGAKERIVLTGPPLSLYFGFQYSFGFQYVVISLQFRTIFPVI